MCSIETNFNNMHGLRTIAIAQFSMSEDEFILIFWIFFNTHGAFLSFLSLFAIKQNCLATSVIKVSLT